MSVKLFDLFVGTPFQRGAWQQLLRLPSGTTVTSSFLAGVVGRFDGGRDHAPTAGLRSQAGWAFRQRTLL
jgi:O6-methylguanine-DNA--protein-cysteine methyltransferase